MPQSVKFLIGFLLVVICILAAITTATVITAVTKNLPNITASEIPDVVIEKESFRRFALLNTELCTYCKESWRPSNPKCKMHSHPLMFQNRESQTHEVIAAELLKWGITDAELMKHVKE